MNINLAKILSKNARIVERREPLEFPESFGSMNFSKTGDYKSH